MGEKFKKWDDFEQELNLTREQEKEIQLEMDLIAETIAIRKKSNMSQRELGKRAGIKQPVIARIENRTRSPQASTLIKMLYPLGYTLKIAPIDKEND